MFSRDMHKKEGGTAERMARSLITAVFVERQAAHRVAYYCVASVVLQLGVLQA